MLQNTLFLYTELAGYMVKCINHLAETENLKVTVIAYPINAEAPFQFEFHKNVTVLSRPNFTTEQMIELVHALKPKLIYASGWADKGYLKVIKSFKSTPTAIGFDNQWMGNSKQTVMSLLARFFIPKWFNFAFVPGAPQVTFAKKMGFKKEQIKEGVYCCDYPLFHSYGQEAKAHRENKWPKKLLWVGRYIPQKGAHQLWNAFIKAKEISGSNWELHCAGTGIDWEARVEHPSIHHHGFVQPKELKELILDAGAFVLPSPFEPWGVVAHEFAACELPLILSNTVGAANQFLLPGENGWLTEIHNENALTEDLIALMKADEKTLRSYGKKSAELAAELTPEHWTATVKSMM